MVLGEGFGRWLHHRGRGFWTGLLITSLVAQTVKRLSKMWETRVRSLGREEPLEKEMAIHSITIAWKIPWTEKPGRLQSMGSQRVGHNWATSLSALIGLPRWLSSKESACQCKETQETGFDPGSGRSLKEGMSTHSSILAWKIPWTEKPGRLQPMGLQRVGHDWATSLSLSYIFLRRQVRWSGIPISWRIFHSLLWSTQSKALV